MTDERTVPGRPEAHETEEPVDVSRRAFVCGAAGLAALGLTSAVASAEAAAAPAKTPQPASATVDQRQLVGYCGIYCGLCESRTRIPEQARLLRALMQGADWEDFGPGQADFPEFWRFLSGLTEVPAGKFCRSGKCGIPDCAIRTCAKGKDLEVCAECKTYPCEKITSFCKIEPLLVADGLRIREIGLGAWIEEQERRNAAGFHYGQIRCRRAPAPEK